jgi:hypothetical protein
MYPDKLFRHIVHEWTRKRKVNIYHSTPNNSSGYWLQDFNTDNPLELTNQILPLEIYISCRNCNTPRSCCSFTKLFYFTYFCMFLSIRTKNPLQSPIHILPLILSHDMVYTRLSIRDLWGFFGDCFV